ncbi:ribonuclease VapC [Steroidobacter agaridevorans]|uniref:Ribonuclease VapC n=1 Tax=Steroidobacter agaridevorans TaxID=2695856 RepID=A0A829YEW4_9GAMM|nr:type II toxin-antitoxin system VapC family toxin [Steroidobacter agaridevorans]GFE81750.1 ribonuclease VapC [Steroidobacter agaridevorans]GFE90494.1 ribonuclease VapC [Steroidobacter agaridevorans]
MLRYLLDTNVVSQPMMKTPSIGVLRKLAAIADECAIAAPVWHELQFGCKRMPAGRRRDALQDYLADVLSTFEILAYDDLAAKLHAIERARLEEQGMTVPFVDSQIAAIAQINELVLVTENVRDFAPFKGLTVENWS